jgi:hypothetical protein
VNRIGRPIPSVRPRAAVAAAGVVGMPAIAPGVVSCQDSTRQLAQHRASDGMSCRGVPDGLAASAAVRPARLSRPSAGGSSLPEICQKRCLAMPHTAPCPLRPPQPIRCDVVVARGVPRRCVWCLRSLHTAEVTGSIPVTPTSTNGFLRPCCDACCQQIASKPPTVVAVALKALPRFGVLRIPCLLGRGPGQRSSRVGIRSLCLGRTSPMVLGVGCGDLRFRYASRDRSCPPRTGGSPMPCGPSTDHGAHATASLGSPGGLRIRRSDTVLNHA